MSDNAASVFAKIRWPRLFAGLRGITPADAPREISAGITLAALIVIPLAVLAGLFVWLKVTEEDDEEILELDQEGA